MGHHESQPSPFSRDHDVPFPSVLPPELAEFLKGRDYACIAQATDEGTVFVVKAPRLEIESCRGRIPIGVRHELYAHPAAPVIRTVVKIYDKPSSPLALEHFTNVEDPGQAEDFLNLSEQTELHLLFYDESLSHRLTKGVGLTEPAAIIEISRQARALLTSIPQDRFNFEEAKAAVMRAARL